MSLAERIALVNKKIAAAARQAGREPSEVTLVAATKVQPSDTIRQAIAAGVTMCACGGSWQSLPWPPGRTETARFLQKCVSFMLT